MYVIKVKNKDLFYHKSGNKVSNLQNCNTYKSKQAAQISIDSIMFYKGNMFTSNSGVLSKNDLEIREVKLELI